MKYSTPQNENQPENQDFSFFDKGLSSKTAGSIGTIESFHQQLQGNAAWKMKIEQIRQEIDASKQTELKAQLPAITPSINITRTPPLRAGLIDGQFVHTNLIQADFDVPTDDAGVKTLIEKLNADPHTRLIFRSTRSKAKAFFTVHPCQSIADHAAAWDAVDAYCKARGYGDIDKKCRPINSLCYISHDTEAVLKDCVPLFWLPSPAPPAQPPVADKPSKQQVNGDEATDAQLLNYLRSWNIPVQNTRSQPSGAVYDILCPWSSEHTDEVQGDTDSAVMAVDGKYAFHCFHNSCDGRGWKDFRQQVAPSKPAAPEPTQTQNTQKQTTPQEEPHRYPTLPVDTSIQAPVFPDYEGEHFTGAFEHLYRAYVDTHALPVASIMAMGIGALGYCAGRRILVKTDERIQHPKFLNTYTLLIGRSDVTAKSETQNELDMMLKLVDDDFFNVSDVQSIEGILRVMEQEYEDYGHGDFYYKRRGYPEGARVYVMLDEVATLFSNARRDGTKNLLHGINKLWKCPEHEKIARAKGRQLVKYPCLSVWGNITPDQVAEHLADSDISGGIINRWMPFFVQPKRETVRHPHAIVDHYSNWILRLKELYAGGEHRTLLFSEEADDARFLWQKETREALIKDDDNTGETRFHDTAIKIAGVFALADNRVDENMVELHHWTNALAVTRYLIECYNYAFRQVGSSPMSKLEHRILDILNQNGNEIALTALRDKTRNVDNKTRHEVLKSLQDGGQVQTWDEATTGRPRKMVRRIE